MHPNTVKRMKSLTKDTSRGFSHICRGLVGLAKHLISKKQLLYVMLGLFTSDLLEKQFGKLRQECSGTYFITMLQILEKVGIAKKKLLLNFDVNIDGFLVHSSDKCVYLLDEDKCNILDSLTDLEKKQPSDVIMTLIYIAGYEGRNDDEINEIYFYYEIYGNYLKDMYESWTA